MTLVHLDRCWPLVLQAVQYLHCVHPDVLHRRPVLRVPEAANGQGKAVDSGRLMNGSERQWKITDRQCKSLAAICYESTTNGTLENMMA